MSATACVREEIQLIYASNTSVPCNLTENALDNFSKTWTGLSINEIDYNSYSVLKLLSGMQEMRLYEPDLRSKIVGKKKVPKSIRLA